MSVAEDLKLSIAVGEEVLSALRVHHMLVGCLELVLASFDNAASSPCLGGLEWRQSVGVGVVTRLSDLLIVEEEMADQVLVSRRDSTNIALELVPLGNFEEVLVEGAGRWADIAEQILLDPLVVVWVAEEKIGVAQLLVEQHRWS